MKLRMICAVLALLLVAGCAPKEAPNTDTPTPNQQEMQDSPTANMTREFAEHGLSFTIPETWAKSEFSVQFDEQKNDGASYDTRTFYAMIDGIRTPVAMVSRFAKEQWEHLVSADSSAEKVKLGESRDGKYVYTYLVKNDITPESDTGKKLLETLRKEAEDLKEKIQITE